MAVAILLNQKAPTPVAAGMEHDLVGSFGQCCYDRNLLDTVCFGGFYVI